MTWFRFLLQTNSTRQYLLSTSSFKQNSINGQLPEVVDPTRPGKIRKMSIEHTGEIEEQKQRASHLISSQEYFIREALSDKNFIICLNEKNRLCPGVEKVCQAEGNRKYQSKTNIEQLFSV